MTWRTSLTVKMLALAAINVVVLAGSALAFLYVELGNDFDSLLLTTARERILAVGRAFALDLNDIAANERDRLADRYTAAYHMRVVLFANDGTQLTGKQETVPDAARAAVVALPEGPESSRRGRGARRPPPDDPLGLGPRRGDNPRDIVGVPPMPDAPPFLVVTNASPKYWIGVRIPIRELGLHATMPGTLLFASTSLMGNPFYFQPLPWLLIVVVALAVTTACWFPFVRGMTRSLQAITEASRDIAEGRFDAGVDVDPRRGDELGALARAIRQMATRLKTLVEGQKRFLADAAHELRSPLARMTMATALIERDGNDAIRRHADDLKDDVELMTHLTDDLLLFARSKLAALPVRVESTDVSEAVTRAVRLEAEDAEVRIAVDPELRVLATPDLLGRALSNLVRNAIQHANPRGPISIRAMLDGEYATIAVADEGAGVPMADLPAMFIPFRRPETSRDRRSGGVGLGLAIVQSAVELCGGTVKCRNLAPRGFEVTLSLRRG